MRSCFQWRCWTSCPSIEEELLLLDKQQLLLMLLLGDNEEMLLRSEVVLLDELPCSEKVQLDKLPSV